MQSTREKAFTQYLALRKENATATVSELVVIALKRQYVELCSMTKEDIADMGKNEHHWHHEFPRAKANALIAELGYEI